MPADTSDLEKMVEAIIVGALDYLDAPLPPEKVQKLVADAAARKNLRRREDANREEARDLVAGLTIRERQTLELVTRGLSSKAIARELGISPRTVEVHRANAFEKINASSTADAIRIGVHAGLDRHD
jgi:FixJ family two-component response regulator